MTYQSQITLVDDSLVELPVQAGSPLFLVGPNGAGKSGLVFKLFHDNPDTAVRISAHRQNWMESNHVPFSPRDKVTNEQNVRGQDLSPTSRYLEWAPQHRPALVIAELIDAENEIGRKVRDALATGNAELATKLAKSASPLQQINELLAGAGVPISLSIGPNSSIDASKRGGPAFSISSLSDGERSAFFISGTVLTCKAGSLVIIDEPERHLHASIVVPLLVQLFALRPDCAFVVSTHELALPLAYSSSSTVVIRDSVVESGTVAKWDLNILPSGAEIDDDTKFSILGSKRKILFIEGTNASLDQPLYEMLFPDVSIAPRRSCGEVERTVDDVNSASEIGWVRAFGIVDQDQIVEGRRNELKAKGVYPLKVYSVESLYFHPTILRQIAEKQSAINGSVVDSVIEAAWDSLFSSVLEHKARLVARMAEGLIKDRISLAMPDWKLISSGTVIAINIDVATVLANGIARIDALLAARDAEGILRSFPVRETPALGAIASALDFKSVASYYAAVRKLVREDVSAKDTLLGFFDGLDHALA